MYVKTNLTPSKVNPKSIDAFWAAIKLEASLGTRVIVDFKPTFDAVFSKIEELPDNTTLQKIVVLYSLNWHIYKIQRRVDKYLANVRRIFDANDTPIKALWVGRINVRLIEP